jgi:hypothetical protein
MPWWGWIIVGGLVWAAVIYTMVFVVWLKIFNKINKNF